MNRPGVSAPPWWSKTAHADRRPFLIGRNKVQSALRSYFEKGDFIEVDTATLQVSPGNETHLHAFATEALTIDGRAAPLYLHTSPEFAAKKLLSAGESRIFTFAHVYRNRERGPLHHPEFTMLEWYRVGEDYEQLMADCADMLKLAADTTGTTRFSFRGMETDPFAEPERLTLAQAFDRFAGIDLLSSIAASGETDRDLLAASVRNAGMRLAEDDTWADLFSKVLVEKIEPHLGRDRATILCEYPVCEAALARPSTSDPRVA